MAIQVMYEGTPSGLYKFEDGVNFEAGMIAMLKDDGSGATIIGLSNGTKVYGLLADRRGSSGAPSNYNLLTFSQDASGNPLLGDESAFGQPGYGNPLSLIPSGTMRTTTLFPDEPTAARSYTTAYIRGGEFWTDIFHGNGTYSSPVAAYTVGGNLYSSANGVLTPDAVVNAVLVGVCTKIPTSNYLWLGVKLVSH